jgi:hypothetical protein
MRLLERRIQSLYPFMLNDYQVIPVRLANSGKHDYVFHTFLSLFKAFQKEPVEPPYPCLKARGIRRPFHEFLTK